MFRPWVVPPVYPVRYTAHYSEIAETYSRGLWYAIHMRAFHRCLGPMSLSLTEHQVLLIIFLSF